MPVFSMTDEKRKEAVFRKKMANLLPTTFLYAGHTIKEEISVKHFSVLFFFFLCFLWWLLQHQNFIIHSRKQFNQTQIITFKVLYFLP
ncbi:hypothetical protein HMPREF1199_02017 [Hoylesella oralis CC98A]|nr:hypothetical protein HMPREF1199_02017 [Hoylesella oralis CC98A]